MVFGKKGHTKSKCFPVLSTQQFPLRSQGEKHPLLPWKSESFTYMNTFNDYILFSLDVSTIIWAEGNILNVLHYDYFYGILGNQYDTSV